MSVVFLDEHVNTSAETELHHGGVGICIHVDFYLVFVEINPFFCAALPNAYRVVIDVLCVVYLLWNGIYFYLCFCMCESGECEGACRKGFQKDIHVAGVFVYVYISLGRELMPVAVGSRKKCPAGKITSAAGCEENYIYCFAFYYNNKNEETVICWCSASVVTCRP